MKKTCSRFLSFMLACLMAFSIVITHATAADTTVLPSQEVSVLTDDSGIMPANKGDYVYFLLGNSAKISAGVNPRFRVWATGGDDDTKVTVTVTTGGGGVYRIGEVNADSKHYLEKQYISLPTSWTFSAYVSSGTNTGRIYCHIEQY